MEGGAGRGEETAGETKPRIRLPDGVGGLTRERGIAMNDLGELNPLHYRTEHHNHVPCIVWDCRDGVIQTLSYEEASVWAQGIKGQPVSTFVEVNTNVCGFRFSERFTTNTVVISKESACVVTTWNVLAIGPPCSFC